MNGRSNCSFFGDDFASFSYSQENERLGRFYPILKSKFQRNTLSSLLFMNDDTNSVIGKSRRTLAGNRTNRSIFNC